MNMSSYLHGRWNAMKALVPDANTIGLAARVLEAPLKRYGLDDTAIIIRNAVEIETEGLRAQLAEAQAENARLKASLGRIHEQSRLTYKDAWAGDEDYNGTLEVVIDECEHAVPELKEKV